VIIALRLHYKHLAYLPSTRCTNTILEMKVCKIMSQTQDESEHRRPVKYDVQPRREAISLFCQLQIDNRNRVIEIRSGAQVCARLVVEHRRAVISIRLLCPDQGALKLGEARGRGPREEDIILDRSMYQSLRVLRRRNRGTRDPVRFDALVRPGIDPCDEGRDVSLQVTGVGVVNVRLEHAGVPGSMEISRFAVTCRVDVVSSNFVCFNVKRLADVAEEMIQELECFLPLSGGEAGFLDPGGIVRYRRQDADVVGAIAALRDVASSSQRIIFRIKEMQVCRPGVRSRVLHIIGPSRSNAKRFVVRRPQRRLDKGQRLGSQEAHRNISDSLMSQISPGKSAGNEERRQDELRVHCH